jgi:hypothetical protein
MNRPSRSTIALISALVVIGALCLIFPRVLAFVELAARELRYFWWLVLMLALGVWLTFFFGKSKH